MAKFCHNCGAQLSDGDVFCMNCGTRQAGSPSQPQPVQPQPSAAAPEPPKKKKKTGLIAGIVAAAVVLALAAVAVFWVWPSFLSPEARYEKYMSRGDTALEAEQYAEAREAYTKAIGLKLEKADPYLGRGDACLALESLGDAIADYESALELEPERAEIYLRLADACVADGDTERAREVLREGIDTADNTKKLESRLDELSPPLASLSGVTGLIQESLSGTELVQDIQEQTGASLAGAFENSARAVAAAMERSPYSALGTFASALVEGQLSASLDMHDAEHSLTMQADLCTDLAALEASLTASMTADGQTAAGELYLGPESGAFHTDLVDSRWYGVTWATLLDDLESSVFVETGAINPEDIAALREELNSALAMGEQAGSLDLSGVDFERYLTLLLAIEPLVESGTDAAGRDYTAVSVPFAAVIGTTADVCDALAADAAVMELAAQLVELTGEDASALRAQWQSELSNAAAGLRNSDVSGSVDLTVNTLNGYVDSIVVSGAPAIDGETMTMQYVISFEYENDMLTRMDILFDASEPYGDTVHLSCTYEAAVEGDVYSDRLAVQYSDGYDSGLVSISNEWNQPTGDITTTVYGGYDEVSLHYTLRTLPSGAELRLDTQELTGVEGEIVLAAYPGEAYLTRPDSFVNLDEWDQDFLEALENASYALEDMLD